MLKQLVIMSSLAVLNGCSLLHIGQYHQDTLQAIEQSQNVSVSKVDAVDTKISQQQEQITLLNNQIATLELAVTKLSERMNETIEKQSSKPKPVVTRKTPNNEPLPKQPTAPLLLGEIEHVSIDNVEHTFDARVDTGAATSSLNAINIEEFERNGKNWVRFQLDEGEGTDGVKKTSQAIEARIVRYVRIRQATSEDAERRAVVELWVKLGTIHEKAEFTLADRSMMTNPILLGREFIRDIALVDVSRKYIHTQK